MNDDSIRKTEVYRLPNNPGLETVLHCVSICKQKALDIAFDHEDVFANFGGILEGSECENYITARAAGPENNMGAFDRCMERFAHNYCRADMKKNQFQHFTASPREHKKGPKTAIRAHSNRLLTIQRHVNSLSPQGQCDIEEILLRNAYSSPVHGKRNSLSLVEDWMRSPTNNCWSG